MYIQITEKTGVEFPKDKNSFLVTLDTGLLFDEISNEKLTECFRNALAVILYKGGAKAYHKKPELLDGLIDNLYEERGNNYLLAAIYYGMRTNAPLEYYLRYEDYFDWDYLNINKNVLDEYQFCDSDYDDQIR